MAEVLVFRHVANEGPGYLGEVLDARGVPWRMVRVDAGDPVPEAPDGAAGLVFMGGPMSANDDLPWVHQEQALIRRAAEAGIPLLGHCLGGQLMSRALGAAVTGNPVTEIGWLPVRRTDGGRSEWLGDLPARFDAFHWHGETFAIPAGAMRLLESDQCANQAWALGDHLALQCHVEMLPAMVREWSEDYADQVAAGGPAVQSAAAMLADVEARTGALRAVADQLYGRWLQGVARQQV